MTKNIVVADDSGMARTFIRQCLQIAGFADATFFEAADGNEALSLLAEHPNMDLVVTDLNMPNKDGAAVLRAVKAVPRFSHIPVIVVTSARNDETDAQLSALGALAVLSKPISPAKLAPVLNSILQ